MIQRAKQEMIPRLKEIWKDCFHDEDAYIDFYYKERFPFVETLVYMEKENPVAMATLIPGTIKKHKETLNVRYVFAVATDPNYQKRGYAASLLTAIKERIGTDYDGTFLVPATTDLFSYYEKFGYQTICEKRELEFDWNPMEHTGENAIHFSKLSSLELFQMREQAFSQMEYVIWDESNLDYIINEWEFCNGQVIKVETENETGSLFYFWDKDHRMLYVKETTLSIQNLMLAIGKLHDSMDFNRVKLLNTISEEKQVIISPFVMACGSKLQHLDYANFMKD